MEDVLVIFRFILFFMNLNFEKGLKALYIYIYIYKSMTIKLIDTYFEDQQKYQKQFGEKTVVYIQVGDFYEIYGAELTNGEQLGVLDKISKLCNFTVSQKKVGLDNSSASKVFMGGFPLYMIDKYVNILVDDHGWTVVVIKQDEQRSGTTRSLEGVYSPGTNIRTSDDSNTLVMIYIESVNNRKGTGLKTVYIGLSSLDCLSGQTTVYETYAYDQQTSIIFDEIHKFVSAKNPREIIVETVNIDHISDQDLAKSLDIYDRQHQINKLKHGKTEKQRGFQEKFFETIYPHNSNISILEHLQIQFKEYGTLSLLLLLTYILDHSNVVLNKIHKPDIWEMNQQLILANNSLQQLNVVENRYNYREPSLLTIIDKTSTVIGGRIFRDRLLNPIKEPNVIQKRYDAIEEIMAIDSNGVPDKSVYQNLEKILNKIRDLERLHRQIAMRTIKPIELSGMSYSYTATIELYKYIQNIIKNNSNLKEHLEGVIPNEKTWKTFMRAKEELDNTYDFDKTNFNTLEKIDVNFFRSGCNDTLDSHQYDIDHSILIFQTFADWMNGVINEQDTNLSMKTVVRYDQSDTYGHHIYLTKNRFITFLDKLKTKTLAYPNNKLVLEVPKKSVKNGTTKIKYEFDIRAINSINKSRCASSNDVVVILDDPGNLDNKIVNLKDGSKNKKQVAAASSYSIFDRLNQKLKADQGDLKSTIIAVYKETIVEYGTKYLESLSKVTKFIGEVDVLKAGAKMAIEFSYVKPTIKTDPKNGSFLSFTEIRHPIIENINTRTPYITNDLELGGLTDGILLFGVNASGKSSLMKAVGINLILAQSGFFVAAKSFEYYPFDYLFTRIWNNDNIFKGQSTFEVEISELRSIIQKASNKSLVLGDELCSGTETVSASAIVTAANAKFIFATHLHFLANNHHLVSLKNVKNLHLSVRYDNITKKLIYDRKLKDGSGPSTYGLEVCKAMGLDEDFLKEAFEIRKEISHDQSGSLLNQKTSKYNSDVRVDTCLVCQTKGEEVHHIQFQCTANKVGMIGSIHKNRESNLVVLCKECHAKVHSNQLIIKGYLETSEGIELDYNYPTQEETAKKNKLNKKYTDDDILYIIKLHKDKMSPRKIKERLEETKHLILSISTIGKIIKENVTENVKENVIKENE
jgi:DNA mismatch repair protein MutS